MFASQLSLKVEVHGARTHFTGFAEILAVRLIATPWTVAYKAPLTVAYKAPLSMEFSRQEYWNGLPFPSPGDLPQPGTM